MSKSQRRSLSSAALAALMVAASATVVLATSLPVGGNVQPLPGAVDTGGTFVTSTGPVFFSTATFQGTLTSSVYSGDTSNPYDPTGTMGLKTFTYLLTDNNTSADGLERLDVSSFTGYQTDVSYALPNSGLVPDYADRATASLVGFSFDSLFPGGAGPLLPGQTSALLVIHTDSNLYTSGMAAVIDAHTSTIWTLAPTFMTVPEPASAVLLGFGLAGVLLVARRKHFRSAA